MQGAVARRRNLTKEDFLDLEIPLPGVGEQQRIAAVLGQVEGLIAQRKQHLAWLNDLLKSVFLDMFGDPVRNEKGWKKAPLANLGTLDRGVSKHRPRNAPELLGGAHPLIQTGDVSNSGIFITSHKQTYSDLGLAQSKSWPAGTLCITIAANIAQTSILTFDACFPDSVVGFIPDNAKSNALYVHGLFWFFQSILEKNAPSAAQKNINLKILRALEVPKPPVATQNQFANGVQQAIKLKRRYQQSLDDLETLHAALSQEAVKGELDLSRVPLPEAVMEDGVVDDATARDEVMETMVPAGLPDYATLTDASGREALLNEWLDAGLGCEDGAAFDAERALDAAQERLAAAFADEDDITLAEGDYETIKCWTFAQLEKRRLTQTLDDKTDTITVKKA